MRRPRLSYANVISSIALFVALGGTGYAVTQLPRNSVGNRQLKANAITSGKIRARAVQRSDLAPSARGGARGPRGPTGPAGPQGPTGPSETIQVKRQDPIGIPAGAGQPVTLASVTLSAGAWLLDGRTTITNGGSGAFFDCTLQTAAGEVFATQTGFAGATADGARGLEVAIHAADALSATTQVLFVCRHPIATDGSPAAVYSNLLATRLGGVENR